MLRRILNRGGTRLGAWLAALALAAVGIVTVRPAGRTVTGVATVVDGDSLRLSGLDIRLKGVDAPETRQTCSRGGQPYGCGDAARRAVQARIRGRDLACRIEGRDRYGRSLARCRLDGEDLGAWLVREGLAVGYRDYEAEEAAARARRAGLWAGEFQRPSDWRRENTS